MGMGMVACLHMLYLIHHTRDDCHVDAVALLFTTLEAHLPDYVH
jgi:hypothetical protein